MTDEPAAADCVPGELGRGGLPPWTYRSDELTTVLIISEHRPGSQGDIDRNLAAMIHTSV